MLSKKSKSGSARFFCPGDNYPKIRAGFATTRCQRTPHRESEKPATLSAENCCQACTALRFFELRPKKTFSTVSTRLRHSAFSQEGVIGAISAHTLWEGESR